jgi:hypothetical protein
MARVRSPLALTAAALAHYPRATQTGAGNPEGGGAARERAPGGAHTGTETPHNGPPRPANRRTASEQPHQKPQAAANATAAAEDEKPTTTTAPELQIQWRGDRHDLPVIVGGLSRGRDHGGYER